MLCWKHWNSLINTSQAELQVFNDSCWIPSSSKSELSAAFPFNLPIPPISLMLFLVSLIALSPWSFLSLHASFSLFVILFTIISLLFKQKSRKKVIKQANRVQNQKSYNVIWKRWKEEKWNIRYRWGRLLVMAVLWITTFWFPWGLLKIRVSDIYSHTLSRILRLFGAVSWFFFSFTCQILMLESNLVKIIKVWTISTF